MTNSYACVVLFIDDSEEAASSESSDVVSDIPVQQTSDANDPLPDIPVQHTSDAIEAQPNCSGSTQQGTTMMQRDELSKTVHHC